MENHHFSPCLYLVWGWGVYREETDSRICPPSCRPGEALTLPPCRSCCPLWPTRFLTALLRWRSAPRLAPTAPRPRWRRKRMWTKEEAGSPGLRQRAGRSYRWVLQVRCPSASGAAPSAGCAASYETSPAGSWTRPDFKKNAFRFKQMVKFLKPQLCQGFSLFLACRDAVGGRGCVGTMSHLDSRLGQVGAHGQAFTHHHVRVVRFLKGLLQSLELLRGEGCATPPLLTMLRAVTSLEYNVLKCAAVFFGRKRNERCLINRTVHKQPCG